MQDEHLGFWSFLIFFEKAGKIENNIFIPNQDFIRKHLKIPSSENFSVGTRSKTLFLTSTAAVVI